MNLNKKSFVMGALSLTLLTSSVVVPMPINKTIPTSATAATTLYKQSATSQLGQLKSGNSRIYTAPGSKSSIAATTKYTHEIFYIMKKAIAPTGDTYYQISRQTNPNQSVIGWIKAKSITRQSYTVQKNTKKTRYIKGTGAGYSRPGGLSRNILLANMAAYKEQTFINTMTVKVGTIYWYRATFKNKIVWLPATALVDRQSVEAIPDPVLTTTSKIARIASTKVRLVKNLQQNDSVVNTTTLVNRSFTITKQALYNKKNYYLLMDGKQEIGWVAVEDVTSYSYKAPSVKKLNLTLTGEGYGYSIPWGGTQDITLKPLTALENTTFTVTQMATVGKTPWYFGRAETGQQLWVSSSRTTANKPTAPEIAAPVISATSKIARIASAQVAIFRDIQQPESLIDTKTLVDRSLTVTKQAFYQQKNYYLLMDGIKEVGWIAEQDVTSYSYQAPSAKKSNLYLTGGGYGYSIPWGGTQDITQKPLTAFEHTAFTVTQMAIVGKTPWYFGTTTTGQQLWVSSSRTLTTLPEAPTTPNYTTNNRQATLKASTLWYTNITTLQTKVPTTAELTEKFSMARSATSNGKEYYELTRTSTAGKTTVVGWVLATAVNSTIVKPASTTKTTLYLTGKGSATNLPSATSATNTVYSSLTNYGAAQFSATAVQQIAGVTYYYGRLASKYVWLRADQFGEPFQYVNLRKASPITQQEMETYLVRKKTSIIMTNNLYKTIPVFLDMQKKYGINAQFMLAHAIVETGWGGSQISQYKNNFFGYQAYDSCAMTCAMYFPTGTDGIQYYADAIYRKYLRVGAIYNNGTTADGMNVKYATDQTWSLKIARIMQEMKPYDANIYDKVAPSTIDPLLPNFNYTNTIPANQLKPASYHDFDAGITAKTTVLTAAKALPYIYGKELVKYTSGQTLTLSGTHNDVASKWMRVVVNGQEAWVSRDSLKIDNLAITTTEANIRDQATTVGSKVLKTVAINTYIKILTDQQGKFITKIDANNQIWYSIQLPKTKKTGWISATIIKIQ
ncbi:hypothetical protein DEX24_09795 [Kurthia sibirica]|uniref:Mannosyl-glycoprotein endo-beta-N-acetylglucosamidase-like domain-containing protein n=1 Tax=Kurthia sibirica TaxID=202750 RepID=A0A2U3AL04_9BACL|nr:hypothetical protein DEX24_09795 [Kurthia sibirica]